MVATSILKRIIQVTDLISGEQSLVIHFSYVGWQENEEPGSIRLLCPMMQLVNLANVLNNPILIHGSLGAGRCGTFVAIHSILEKISSLQLKGNNAGKERISFPEIVIHLRNQRPGLVSNEIQYRSIYNCVLFFMDPKNQKDVKFENKQQVEKNQKHLMYS